MKGRCGGWARRGKSRHETTAQVADTPGQPVVPGAMGRPLSGDTIALLDPDGRPAPEGEVCLRLWARRPFGLMQGYEDETGRVSGADGDVYRTGDVAFRGEDGTPTFVGRADDVFESSDCRISPFERESVLIEHPAVVEAAVVPRPDPVRLAVPVAYVILAAGTAPDRATAPSIFRHLGGRPSIFERVRRIGFVEAPPKTISGNIRRVELRRREHAPPGAGPPSPDGPVFDLAGFTAGDLGT